MEIDYNGRFLAQALLLDWLGKSCWTDPEKICPYRRIYKLLIPNVASARVARVEYQAQETTRRHPTSKLHAPRAKKKKETTERTRHILKQKEQCSEEVGWKRSNNQGILGSALRDTGQKSRSLWILRRGFFLPVKTLQRKAFVLVSKTYFV